MSRKPNHYTYLGASSFTIALAKIFKKKKKKKKSLFTTALAKNIEEEEAEEEEEGIYD